MKKLTRRAAKSSEFPAFSWETFLLATDRRRVGEPVEAVADILIDLFGYPREDNCSAEANDTGFSRTRRGSDLGR